MSSTEEDLLVRIPEPAEDWAARAQWALDHLNRHRPGHTQEWLYLRLRESGMARSFASVNRWLRGHTIPQEVASRIDGILRAEEELHRKGNCSKARYISPLRMAYANWPEEGPRRGVRHRQPITLGEAA